MPVHHYNFKLCYRNKERCVKATNDSSLSSFLVALAHHVFWLTKDLAITQLGTVRGKKKTNPNNKTQYTSGSGFLISCIFFAVELCGLVGQVPRWDISAIINICASEQIAWNMLWGETLWRDGFLVFSSMGKNLHKVQLPEIRLFQKVIWKSTQEFGERGWWPEAQKNLQQANHLKDNKKTPTKNTLGSCERQKNPKNQLHNVEKSTKMADKRLKCLFFISVF